MCSKVTLINSSLVDMTPAQYIVRFIYFSLLLIFMDCILLIIYNYMKHLHDTKVKSKKENNVYSKKSSFHSFPLQSVFPPPTTGNYYFFLFSLQF